MKIKCRSFIERANLFFSIAACVLFLIAHIMLIFGYDEYYHFSGDMIAEAIRMLIEALPFAALLIPAIMQKKDEYNQKPIIPIALFTVRAVVDTIVWLAYVIFDLQLISFSDDYIALLYIFIFIYFAIIFFAVYLSRFYYFSMTVMLLILQSIFITDGLPHGIKYILLFAAYAFWAIASIGFCVTITDENRKSFDMHAFFTQLMIDIGFFSESSDYDDGDAYMCDETSSTDDDYDIFRDNETVNLCSDVRKAYFTIMAHAISKSNAELLEADKAILDCAGAAYLLELTDPETKSKLINHLTRLKAEVDNNNLTEPSDCMSRLAVLLDLLLCKKDEPCFELYAAQICLIMVNGSYYSRWTEYVSAWTADNDKDDLIRNAVNATKPASDSPSLPDAQDVPQEADVVS